MYQPVSVVNDDDDNEDDYDVDEDDDDGVGGHEDSDGGDSDIDQVYSLSHPQSLIHALITLSHILSVAPTVHPHIPSYPTISPLLLFLLPQAHSLISSRTLSYLLNTLSYFP